MLLWAKEMTAAGLRLLERVRLPARWWGISIGDWFIGVVRWPRSPGGGA